MITWLKEGKGNSSVHLDRPKFYDESKSLRLVAQRVGEMLGNTKVSFVNDCIGKPVLEKIEKLNFGEILLLENLRFHPEEEEKMILVFAANFQN